VELQEKSEEWQQQAERDRLKFEEQLSTIFQNKKKLNYNENSEERLTMMAGRPLQGWKCLSCEQKLQNYHVEVAEYVPWNGLPISVNSPGKDANQVS
jgi:hypothetical protein